MRERKGCLPAIIYTVLILALFLLFVGLSQCKQKETTEYTANSKAGDRIYADILSIAPTEYFAPMGGGHGAYLCQAGASNGQTIWIYISKDHYTRFMDPYVTDALPPVSFSEPMRIYGDVIRAENVAEGLSARTGNFVIEFTHTE